MQYVHVTVHVYALDKNQNVLSEVKIYTVEQNYMFSQLNHTII